MENLLPKGMLGTPRRTVLAGIAALVVATILLLVYLSHYRSSVESENATVPVLVATHLIKKGTSAESLARGGYEVKAIPKDQVTDGAIIDAGTINGQITSSDILPEQQLTEDDFGATSGALSASSDLLGTGPRTGTWRAIAIAPLDDAHGIKPQAQTGDHVDIYVQMDTRLGLLMPNVLVLAAPDQVAAGTSAPTSTNYILRVPTQDVTRFAYAADNGKIWFVLRPQDEKQTKPAGTTPANSANVILGQ